MTMEISATRQEPVAFGAGEDANMSGVSWGAVLGGAAGAAALSYALVILGFGLGLSSVSPWSFTGATATTIGVATILWLTLTQIAASSLGGYVAGRLRVKWPTVHTDEVYFRDTAHGFLSWAVASLLVAAFLASAIAGVLRGGAMATAAAVGGATAVAGAGAVKVAGDPEAQAYYVDTLLRAPPGAPPGANASVAPTDAAQLRAETGRIFAKALVIGDLSIADRAYLGQQVAQRTGVDNAQGEQRVDEVYAQLKQSVENAKAQAKQAADDTRKATAGIAVWMFISLLCGAFFASLSATLGGRHRDTFVHGPRTAHR
ncbi:uncharacterized protein YjbJ (UPF0337 family) [Dokdonella fugitiva]|uniref:Uncharacterized protein YjbJ (UPF0337 family) n=2 Tax=Dokdonella fugitiva TaxID=328517 RepID=A0A839EY22_9GAMM|nr:uncharacterized protein YjbJ (UPF0337 family) [Dokdonella fugitiva]